MCALPSKKLRAKLGDDTAYMHTLSGPLTLARSRDRADTVAASYTQTSRQSPWPSRLL